MLVAIGIHRNRRPQFAQSGGRVFGHHATCYVTRGRGYFEDDETPRQAVGPGNVFFLRPGTWHNFDPDPGTTWGEAWVIYNGAAVEAAFGPIFPTGTLFRIGHDARLITAWERLLRLWSLPGAASEPALRFHLHELLFYIYQQVQPQGRSRHGLATVASAWFEPRLDELRPDWRELSSRHGLSYESFRKKFRRETGLPPNQFLLNLKLRRAQELLLETELPVGEVARRCGFEGLPYFSRYFRRQAGVSPRSFRSRPGA